ncbi:DUF4190 domain-containing protein [Amycolatopsis australiensis]|uniref:Septum formation n=1 Tax=Amycolatopsis australiensis TaxID=546364 RepID=A0A1K1S546_9PSEU|nr:DUF4190 domain-containing protein [Amycolatopsis australiensis]SFW79322.1 Septum formation [Amycolatopsis australiensis]
MSEQHPPGGMPPSPPQWMAMAPAPPGPRGRNGFAVASLILGILGICGFSLVLGLIFGIVALVQIGKSGQAGRGMAIAGIVLSVLWVGALTVGVIVLVKKTELLATTPTIVALQPGECYNTPAAYGLDATKVSCAEPHDGEAFATVPLKGYVAGEYPGEETLEAQAKAGCEAQRATVFGPGYTPPVEASVGVFYPDSKAWLAGKSAAVCTFQVTSDKQFTGPLRH